ncbi:MAG: hypothetical protein ABW123_24590 [Cystobacter sp.]
MWTESRQALVAPPASPHAATVSAAGAVSVGGAVQAACGNRPGYDGYTLQAAAGTQVKLEVTHLGSSMYLDTGVFLYGPKDASGRYGEAVLFQDDDSGYGELSRISVATLPQAGEYQVVVGWNNAPGKQYRLQVDCVGGACVSQPAPAPTGAALVLVEQPLTAALSASLDAANTVREDQYAYLRRFDFAWPYSTEASLDAAASAVLALKGYSGYRPDAAPQVLTPAQLEQHLYRQYQPLLTEVLATYGASPENVQVKSYRREFSTGPNGDNWRTLNVILLPRAFKVIVYEQTAHEI